MRSYSHSQWSNGSRETFLFLFLFSSAIQWQRCAVCRIIFLFICMSGCNLAPTYQSMRIFPIYSFLLSLVHSPNCHSISSRICVERMSVFGWHSLVASGRTEFTIYNFHQLHSHLLIFITFWSKLKTMNKIYINKFRNQQTNDRMNERMNEKKIIYSLSISCCFCLSFCIV